MAKELILKGDGSMKYEYDHYSIRYSAHAMDRMWERKENIPYHVFFETIQIVASRLMETKTMLRMYYEGYSHFIVRSPEGIVMVFVISRKNSLVLVTVWNEQDLGEFNSKGDPEFRFEITRSGLNFKQVKMEAKIHGRKAAV